jgi:hypothetical protein
LRLVVALFHYSSDQAVSVPLGFISGRPEHIEIARQILEGFTKGKHHIYAAAERDTDLDLAQEFAALCNKSEI